MNIRPSPVAFSILYCVAYVAAYVGGRPLFLFYPLRRQWVWGSAPDPTQPGPVIVWYGLVASAVLVAGVGAFLVRDRWLIAAMRQWLWIWPYAAIGVCLYMLRPFFL
jgi:hypothetical protein